jgi:hypothetical protein
MRIRSAKSGETPRKKRESHTQHWFYIVLGLSSAIVGGIIVVAIYVFLLRGTVLFLQSDDRYDVFVTLLLILLTLLGVMGYGVYMGVGSKLENKLNEKERELESRLNERLRKEEQVIQNRQNLFKAKVMRSMGFLFWELFKVERKKENGKSTSVSKQLITLAIARAKTSLDYAKEVSGNEYKEDIYRCKSNLVYFLAEAVGVQGCKLTKDDKKQTLKLTNEILEEVSKQDYQEYYHYLESCAWALQHLSEEKDKVSKQNAGNIIRELLDDRNIPYSWRESIEEKWVDFL